MDETSNEQNLPINEMDETLNEQTPPTNAAPGDEVATLDSTPSTTDGFDAVAPNEAQDGPEDGVTSSRDLPSLPPQYATGGDLGFFTRTTETVPAAQTVGPDGAIYIAELTGLPYPEGYARVIRVEDPGSVSGFDGEVPSGVAQTYASGFDQIHSLAFDSESNLYVLEYQNATEVYDPTLVPSELPPSTLIKVEPDGTRETISGEELKLANYIIADPTTNDIYASINNTEAEAGKVLRYSENSDTGEYDVEVVADELESPRGLSFGPDGNLYVLEQGVGTPLDDPNVEDAPVVQLIPGVVGQRGGYTGEITKINIESGEQERIYEGLPSFQEFNPQTGEDRPFGVGARGFDIAEDGTVWIASGGGLSDATAEAAGEVGQDLRGLLRLDGLFGDDPSQATWTELFDSVTYAGENGPDGATTLFNTQSNLNDVTVGPDGNLYAIDAARNVLYEISGEDGETVESVTVLQKRPPVLTEPQYAAVLETGGDPAADYRVEISNRTYKGANALPDTPGRQQALLALDGEGSTTPSFDPNFVPTPRGEDAAGAIGDVAGQAGVPGDFSGGGEDTAGAIGDVAGQAGVPGDFSGGGEDAGAIGLEPGGDILASADAQMTNSSSPAQEETPDGTAIEAINNPAGESGDVAGQAGVPGNFSGESEDTLPVGVEPGDVLASADAQSIEPPFSAPEETPDGTPVEAIDSAADVSAPDSEDPAGTIGDVAGQAGVPGDFNPINPPDDLSNVPGPVADGPLLPGPVDPVSPPVIENNPYADYFDPFFGTYAPAEDDVPMLPDEEGSYTVDDLFVFGDRLTENGGEFGKNAVAESTGANPPYDEAPYSEEGSFTDGSNWTTYLGGILGVEESEQDTNFSYLDATARELENPTDPFGDATELNTFAGQIDTFEETYGTFTEDDLVVVNFGGNDLTLPPEEGVAPEEAAQQSIEATVEGIANLQELGADNFLVGLVPPVELAPIFSDQEFLDLLGVEPGFFDPIVDGYNQGLTAALEEYEAESGANIEILDTNTLFDSIAAEPEAYGFINVDEPVLSSKTPVTGEPIVYNEEIVGQDPAVQHATLFIDPYFHPTALGHSIVAETARDELLDLGEDVAEPTGNEMLDLGEDVAEPTGNEMLDLGEDVTEPTLEGTGLTVGLYDTNEDTLIAPLEDGTQIQASEVAGKNLTISALVPEDSPYYEQVESVFLDLNDGQATRTEIMEPYALFGDNNGDYFQAGVDLQGENTIAFELYSQDELGGEMLGSMDVDFSIV